MSSNKRITGSIDRLSALPDSLLIRILTLASLHSDVNVRDAARTLVLSKRWRYLWCELTGFRLINRNGGGDDGDIDETYKFVAIIHRALLCRTAKSLEEYNLVFYYYNRCWAYHVDIWVEFALKLNSKIVSLSLPEGYSTRYSLPELFYSNSVLTELDLGNCIVAPRGRVDWKSLTKLRMGSVELHQHVVENILSGCPVMCSLELQACWGFNSLKIDSPCLRKLCLIDRYPVRNEEDSLLEISAPYLSSLDIHIYLKGRKVWLKNISAVVEVNVDIGSSTKRRPAYVLNAVKELFEQIQHIKKLHMKSNFFKIVSMMVLDGWQLQPQSRRLSLKIDNLYCFYVDCGVLSLLASCPNLETLQLHEATRAPLFFPPLSMSDDLNCDLLHLKMVEMKISVSFDNISVGSCSMLMLVRILLRRAVALEKMEIRFEIKNRDLKIEDRERFDKVVEEVLSWPKSSSQALLITSLVRINCSSWY